MGEVAVLRPDRALVEPARQQFLGDPRRRERVDPLVLGRKPRRHEPAEVIAEAMLEAERHDPERVKRWVVLVDGADLDDDGFDVLAAVLFDSEPLAEFCGLRLRCGP